MSLVILTLEYPYGLGEAFLHEEVRFLSKHFDRIVIIPSKAEGEKRALPQNVHCYHQEEADSSKKNLFKVLSKYPLTAASILLYELLHNAHRVKYLKYWKSFLGHIAADLGGYDTLLSLIQKYDLQASLFYDYWFTNRSLSLAKLKRKKLINRYILRTHRFDLYDEVQFEETVPFRMSRLKGADKVFAISKHGEQYLHRRASGFEEKITCSYLGVKPSANLITEKKADEFLVVSCGRLITSKRSHLIPCLFQDLERIKLKWVHFGDGPLKEELMREFSALPADVTLDFKGEVPNQEILKFYQKNYVDLFISLSISEGIPVSIMEAMMHGIPTLACKVNGVPEIVTEETGWCLPPTEEIDQIDLQFYLREQHQMDRKRIKELTVNKFDSEVNYRSFLEEIKQI